MRGTGLFDRFLSTAKKLVFEFASENCSYEKPSHSVTCSEPVLAVGDTVTFEIQVRAKDNLVEINNEAGVSTTLDAAGLMKMDPDLNNNHDKLLMTAQGGP